MPRARQPRSAVGLKICDWCGRYFCAAPQHVYTDKNRWFCKYSCMLRYREDREQKRQLKKEKKQEGQKNEIKG